MRKNLKNAILFPPGFALGCVSVVLMLSTHVSQAQTFSSWNIKSEDLNGGRVLFQAGEPRTIQFTVKLTRGTNSAGQYNPVNYTFTFARQADLGAVEIQSFTATTSDFDGPIMDKDYTITLTAASDYLSGSKLIKTNDKLIILAPSGMPASNTSYYAGVQYSGISNNTVCCSKCVGRDEAVGTFQVSQPQGGDGTYIYRWEQSTNGTTFEQMTPTTATINPGKITRTTWYRRLVMSGTPAYPIPDDAPPSNTIKIEFVDALQAPTIGTTSYAQNTTVNGIGTMTIQGNQTPAAGVQVDFRSNTQVKVLPNTVIKPSATIGISTFCTSTSGRMASVSAEAAPSITTVESLPEDTQTQSGAAGVYPNPSSGIVQVDLGGAVFDAKVVVLNKFSNIVHTTDVPPGDSHITLDLSALPADTYYLRVTGAPSLQKTTRIILRR